MAVFDSRILKLGFGKKILASYLNFHQSDSVRQRSPEEYVHESDQSDYRFSRGRVPS